MNISILQRLGVTAVLNLADPTALRASIAEELEQPGITDERIDAEDDPDYNILQRNWEEAEELQGIAENTWYTVSPVSIDRVWWYPPATCSRLEVPSRKRFNMFESREEI